jgi:hypothetical protein
MSELTTKRVRARISRGEGQKTEFKESVSEESEIIRSLGALAHANGGSVFVGVRDDRTIRGVTIGRNTLENLANQIARQTQPPLHPEVEEFDVDGKNIIVITIAALPVGEIVQACGVHLIRVGKTNQTMSPTELRRRLFAGFTAENTASVRGTGTESWHEREERRIKAYQDNRGLFLVHTWRPSEDPGEVADIVISVRQHPGENQPLTDGHIKSVEYHLGPKFFNRTVVKTSSEDGVSLGGFRLRSDALPRKD